MAFRRRMESMEDFLNALRAGEDYVLTNGDVWFTKEGKCMDGGDAEDL